MIEFIWVLTHQNEWMTCIGHRKRLSTFSSVQCDEVMIVFETPFDLHAYERDDCRYPWHGRYGRWAMISTYSSRFLTRFSTIASWENHAIVSTMKIEHNTVFFWPDKIHWCKQQRQQWRLSINGENARHGRTQLRYRNTEWQIFSIFIYLSLRMDGRRRRLRMCRPWMTKSLWCHPMDLTVAIQMKMSCYYNSAIRDTMRSVFGAKRCLLPLPLLPNCHSCCYSWR